MSHGSLLTKLSGLVIPVLVKLLDDGGLLVTLDLLPSCCYFC
jgi:hypothetical protein